MSSPCLLTESLWGDGFSHEKFGFLPLAENLDGESGHRGHHPRAPLRSAQERFKRASFCMLSGQTVVEVKEVFGSAASIGEKLSSAPIWLANVLFDHGLFLRLATGQSRT